MQRPKSLVHCYSYCHNPPCRRYKFAVEDGENKKRLKHHSHISQETPDWCPIESDGEWVTKVRGVVTVSGQLNVSESRPKGGSQETSSSEELTPSNAEQQLYFLLPSDRQWCQLVLAACSWHIMLVKVSLVWCPRPEVRNLKSHFCFSTDAKVSTSAIDTSKSWPKCWGSIKPEHHTQGKASSFV